MKYKHSSVKEKSGLVNHSPKRKLLTNGKIYSGACCCTQNTVNFWCFSIISICWWQYKSCQAQIKMYLHLQVNNVRQGTWVKAVMHCTIYYCMTWWIVLNVQWIYDTSRYHQQSQTSGSQVQFPPKSENYSICCFAWPVCLPVTISIHKIIIINIYIIIKYKLLLTQMRVLAFLEFLDVHHGCYIELSWSRSLSVPV